MSIQSTVGTNLIIQVSLDKDHKAFPIRISIKLSDIELYIRTTDKFRQTYDKRLRIKINNEISKFDGKSSGWTIDHHVPLQTTIQTNQ